MFNPTARSRPGPQDHKRRSGKARKGDAALRTALCDAAWAAAHTKDGYLRAQYRRFLRRFGKKNGTSAPDYFERRNDTDARRRYLVRELEKLGQTVTLEPAA